MVFELQPTNGMAPAIPALSCHMYVHLGLLPICMCSVVTCVARLFIGIVLRFEVGRMGGLSHGSRLDRYLRQMGAMVCYLRCARGVLRAGLSIRL